MDDKNGLWFIKTVSLATTKLLTVNQKLRGFFLISLYCHSHFCLVFDIVWKLGVTDPFQHYLEGLSITWKTCPLLGQKNCCY